MKRENLQKFFEKYIKDTPEKAAVIECKILICRLTNIVCNALKIHYSLGKVYLTSRMLKHLFDRKPAEEFFCVLKNVYKITKFPDKIYQNKFSKRGEYCLVKRIGDSEYLCSIEIVKLSSVVLKTGVIDLFKGGDDKGSEEIQIATVFRLRDDHYIKKYTLLWSWEDGDPHRSALDTPEGTTCAPQ